MINLEQKEHQNLTSLKSFWFEIYSFVCSTLKPLLVGGEPVCKLVFTPLSSAEAPSEWRNGEKTGKENENGEIEKSGAGDVLSLLPSSSTLYFPLSPLFPSLPERWRRPAEKRVFESICPTHPHPTRDVYRARKSNISISPPQLHPTETHQLIDVIHPRLLCHTSASSALICFLFHFQSDTVASEFTFIKPLSSLLWNLSEDRCRFVPWDLLRRKIK